MPDKCGSEQNFYASGIMFAENNYIQLIFYKHIRRP